MRKLLFIILAIIAAVAVFSVLIFFLLQNKDKGALQVTSTPNSKVYLDGKAVGQTPFRTNDVKNMIPAGEHTIELVPLSGNFVPFEQKITISPRVLTVVDRNFAPTGLADASIISLSSIDNKKDSQISVVTFPQGAQVYLDSNLEGQTPILMQHITESDHELRISKDGYRDKTIRIKTVLGYRLDALIYLGINPAAASQSATPVSSPSALLNTPTVTITNTPTGFLRVREKPDVSSPEVTQVKPGETYPLLNETNGWYEIKLTDGKTGWISAEYSTKN